MKKSNDIQEFIEQRKLAKSEKLERKTNDCWSDIVEIQELQAKCKGKKVAKKNCLKSLNFDYTTTEEWNEQMLANGYADPTEMFLDNGFKLVKGEPQAGDISWFQEHQFAGFKRERETHAVYYDGEKWMKRGKTRHIPCRDYEVKDYIARNGVFRYE